MVGKFMHKNIIHKIHSRIGFWIKYHRKQSYILTNDEKFKQDKFILLNNEEEFLDFVPNEAICSRSTLSRIENGKIIYEKSLLLFFIKRFNKKYRISESDQHLIESTINVFKTYFYTNNKLPISYLKKILTDTNLKVEDDFLWDEDKIMLLRILEWFTDFKLIQKNDFDEYYQKFKIYHKSVQNILIHYFAFSVYFNPELWTYNPLISKLIKEEYPTNELLSVFESLFCKSPDNIFKLLYQENCYCKNAGFLKELIITTKLLFEKNKVLNYRHHNLKYIQLTQKIMTKDYQSDSLFEHELLNKLSNLTIKENDDIYSLIKMVEMEPYPRIINKLILDFIYPKIKSKFHFQLILSIIMR
jgi:hypothetical protein